jgi:pimeloyl-ACP methyl ester carboxylesterase
VGNEARDVVLLHGLWMPGIVMSPLAARLAERGFRTHVFDYASRRKPIGMHAERLARFAREAAGGAPVHFVGHSLGGLVVLAALASAQAPAVARVVLLGTPARGCMAGRRLARVAAGRWMLGESEPLWKEGRVAHWDADAHGGAALGVIAGSTPIGLGRVLGRLPGVNDGVVRLEETDIAGMAERIVLPVGHTELIFSARVVAQAAQFLAHGRFSNDA